MLTTRKLLILHSAHRANSAENAILGHNLGTRKIQAGMNTGPHFQPNGKGENMAKINEYALVKRINRQLAHRQIQLVRGKGAARRFQAYDTVTSEVVEDNFDAVAFARENLILKSWEEVETLECKRQEAAEAEQIDRAYNLETLPVLVLELERRIELLESACAAQLAVAGVTEIPVETLNGGEWWS
jgi:hypothetical protein